MATIDDRPCYRCGKYHHRNVECYAPVIQPPYQAPLNISIPNYATADQLAALEAKLDKQAAKQQADFDLLAADIRQIAPGLRPRIDPDTTPTDHNLRNLIIEAIVNQVRDKGVEVLTGSYVGPHGGVEVRGAKKFRPDLMADAISNYLAASGYRIEKV